MIRNKQLLLPGSTDIMERKGAGEDYEDRYEKTGKKAKKDWDGDGEIEDDEDEDNENEDEDEEDKPKSKKKKTKKESFSYSNWRNELAEDLGTTPDTPEFDPAVDSPSMLDNQEKDQVKENSKIKNKVIINPTIQENIKKLQRNHLSTILEFVMDHFYDMGLSGKDIINIMEDTGDLAFYEYLLYSMDDGLYESHVNRRKFSPMHLAIIEEHLSNVVLNYGFNEWIDQLISEGYDISGYTINEMRKIYVNEQFLAEKSESQSQQRLFGLALAVKRGETSRDEVSKEVLDIVDKMSTAEIRKFAKTKRSGLPETKGGK
jgi:hypothetical protein